MHRNQKRRQLLEARAHGLRSAPTWSEQALGRLLAELGLAVRRQLVVGGFVADFAVPAAKLLIEVDGPWHARRRAADARRDRKLVRLGWRVLRLEAELVRREPEGRGWGRRSGDGASLAPAQFCVGPRRRGDARRGPTRGLAGCVIVLFTLSCACARRANAPRAANIRCRQQAVSTTPRTHGRSVA